MSDKPCLELKSEPDGYGFIYGQVFAADGEVYRVDIMPPIAEWRGDFKLDGCLPHATDWVVYLDGVEIARVSKRDELQTAVTTKLIESKA